jgi:ABC-2 type transport system ATP-binding protein
MSSPLPASNVALTVKDICKSYGETVAAGPLSFSLTVDSTTGLLGSNGAGKTTTIGMIMGLIEPTSGSIRVFGRDMAHERHHVLGRMNFSRVPTWTCRIALPCGKICVCSRGSTALPT